MSAEDRADRHARPRREDNTKSIHQSAQEAVLAGLPITANPYLNSGKDAIAWESEWLRQHAPGAAAKQRPH